MVRVNLFSFNFASSSFDEIIQSISSREYINPHYLPFLITPNSDQVLQFNQNEDLIELKGFYAKSYFILPDGAPILAFSRLVKRPLRNKLSGSDLFPVLWDFIKKNNRDTFIIAPSEQVALMLQREMPSLKFYVPGFIPVNDITGLTIEADKIISSINGEIPEFLIIGLGFPKQEILMKIIYEKLLPQGSTMPLLLLLGASFEFYLNVKKRAPLFLQKTGFEWLHRLSQEPKRLWRRYTIGVAEFIFFFLAEYFKEKLNKKGN